MKRKEIRYFPIYSFKIDDDLESQFLCVLKIAKCKCLCRGLLCFDCSYSPGDIVVIQPENSDAVVDEFTQLLGLNQNETLKLSSIDAGKYIAFVCLSKHA